MDWDRGHHRFGRVSTGSGRALLLGYRDWRAPTSSTCLRAAERLARVARSKDAPPKAGDAATRDGSPVVTWRETAADRLSLAPAPGFRDGSSALR